jgi:DNA-binding NarL/FixJ family response regulator
MKSGVRPLRCVIVDDNPHFLEAAAKLLARQGISIAGMASTITDALDLVAQLQPDVAVVDINLGTDSGFDLAELLADSAVPSPVILTSTCSEQEFDDLITASPALGFVPKTALSADAIRALLDPEGPAATYVRSPA